MKLVTLSSKNQITVPKAMLGLIGAKPKDKFFIEYYPQALVLRPVGKSITRQTAGSLAKYIAKSKRGKSLEKIMQETKKISAKKLVSHL